MRLASSDLLWAMDLCTSNVDTSENTKITEDEM